MSYFCSPVATFGVGVDINTIKLMIMENLSTCFVALFFVAFLSCNSLAQEDVYKSFREEALYQSAVPIRPGIPGKRPFWNAYAKRFIYAPAFDYHEVDGATKYRYAIFSSADSNVYKFESDVPYAPLSPVWIKVPVGKFRIRVTGLSENGDSLGVAGTGQYYRASPYAPQDSVYDEPVMPYDVSAMVALAQLMHKDYVNYWLVHKSADPDYVNYKYPAKIWSALIVGAVTYARLNPGMAEAKRATKLARIVADRLIEISFPKGSYLEYVAPTYYGKRIASQKKSFINLNNSMPMIGARAGNAYLDLYDLTKEEKYLSAAKKVAKTYIKTQLDNGSWYLYVNPITGAPTAEGITIPMYVINYFDRLRDDYGMKGLDRPIQQALNWVMENPVKTFNWTGQFEDVGDHVPYKDLSREQACDLAIYLFKNDSHISLAEELVRFAEDQFVIWEQPRDFWIGKKRETRMGAHSLNWITPCVQEQYVYWMPVSRSAGIMVQTFWEAYAATGKAIYLAKAKSIANAFTRVQKVHDGDYPTFFTRYPLPKWLNSTVYPAKILMTLQQSINRI